MQETVAGKDFRVVCLGGSAGALQAYMDILRGLPTDTGMAFVVAPHRALENAHLLPQLSQQLPKCPSPRSSGV
jgi:chemotaxis response regulator CheB